MFEAMSASSFLSWPSVPRTNEVWGKDVRRAPISKGSVQQGQQEQQEQEQLLQQLHWLEKVAARVKRRPLMKKGHTVIGILRKELFSVFLVKV